MYIYIYLYVRRSSRDKTIESWFFLQFLLFFAIFFFFFFPSLDSLFEFCNVAREAGLGRNR